MNQDTHIHMHTHTDMTLLCTVVSYFTFSVIFISVIFQLLSISVRNQSHVIGEDTSLVDVIVMGMTLLQRKWNPE